MNETQIDEHIEGLVAEEHRLLEHGDRSKLTKDDIKRLDEISVRLDQYWDLLRQRRARRDADRTRRRRRAQRGSRRALQQ